MVGIQFDCDVQPQFFYILNMSHLRLSDIHVPHRPGPCSQVHLYCFLDSGADENMIMKNFTFQRPPGAPFDLFASSTNPLSDLHTRKNELRIEFASFYYFYVRMPTSKVKIKTWLKYQCLNIIKAKELTPCIFNLPSLLFYCSSFNFYLYYVRFVF